MPRCSFPPSAALPIEPIRPTPGSDRPVRPNYRCGRATLPLLLAAAVWVAATPAAAPAEEEGGDGAPALAAPAPAEEARDWPIGRRMEPAHAPGPDHHEFNPQIPRMFTGMRQTFEGTGPDGAPLTAQAYITGPSDAGRQILLIHEWWGLNAHIQGVADQFGRMGWRAWAIDLYDGQSATKTSEARALMQAAMEAPDAQQAKLGIVLAAMEAENPAARRATIGWCFGGGWSLQAAIHEAELVDAAVVYYGQLETDAANLASLRAPVLCVIAARDTWVTPALAAKFEAAMAEAGKRVEVATYEADHAFANPSGERFELEAARAAWAKTLAFLDAELGADGGTPATE